jgi:uncharacterized membrane protein YhiD involved in acid resistance
MERQPFRYSDSEGTFFTGMLQIALGVFIGALAALFAYEGISAYRMKLAAQDAAKEMKAAVDRQNAAAAQARNRLEQQRQQAQEQEERQRQAQQAMIAEHRERQARKDAAFQRFYKPSSACQADPATVPCANEYMQAKKRFEDTYVDR